MSSIATMEKRTPVRTPLDVQDLAAVRILQEAWANYKQRPKDKRLTQEQIAEKYHLKSQSAVTQYINGHIRLNPVALAALCKVFGLDPYAVHPRISEEGNLVVDYHQPTSDTAVREPLVTYGEGKERIFSGRSILVPGSLRTPMQEMLGSFGGKKEVVSERAVDTWHPEDALPAGYTTINAVEARHADLGGGSRYALVDYPDEKPRVYSTEFFSRHKLDPRNLRAYRVSGDSMKPMLWDGCWVVIDTSKTVIVDERIYALAVGDELLVKQLVRGVGNKILVNSFNPSHPTQVVDPEVLPVQIFGQVVEYSCVLV